MRRTQRRAITAMAVIIASVACATVMPGIAAATRAAPFRAVDTNLMRDPAGVWRADQVINGKPVATGVPVTPITGTDREKADGVAGPRLRTAALASGWNGWLMLNEPTSTAYCKPNSPTVARTPDGSRMDIFIHEECSDGSVLYQAVNVNDVWYGWFRLPTPAYGFLAPGGVTASWASNDRLDIMGEDNWSQVIQMYWTPQTGFQYWFNLGAPQPSGYLAKTAGVPSITWTNYGGKLFIFARGPDFALHFKEWTAATGWSSWFTLNGNLTSAPASTAHHDGTRIDAFYVGTDNAVWQRYYVQNAGWLPRSSLGGNVTSKPTATFVADGHRFDVFARGTDGALYQKYWTGAYGWSNWVNLGGQIHPGERDPSASWRYDGNRIDIAAIAPDERPMVKTWICC